jgi:hypothetical protein
MKVREQYVKTCIFPIENKPRKVQFDIEKLAHIQARIKSGITKEEMAEFTEWILAREFHNNMLEHIGESDKGLVEKTDIAIDLHGGDYSEVGGYAEDVEHASFFGGCVPTRQKVIELASWCNVSAFGVTTDNMMFSALFHVASCIDFKEAGNFGKRHRFLIDPTFRQFCIDQMGYCDVGKKLATSARGRDIGTALVNQGFANFDSESVKTYFNAFDVADMDVPAGDYLKNLVEPRESYFAPHNGLANRRTPRDILELRGGRIG